MVKVSDVLEGKAASASEVGVRVAYEDAAELVQPVEESLELARDVAVRLEQECAELRRRLAEVARVEF